MVTFRNNKRGRFKNNSRNFKRGNDNHKFKSDFVKNPNFHGKSTSRNNHNASKLVEKYNNLGREALANEDKILSESYFQYADHFVRVLSEQTKNQSIKILENSNQDNQKVIPKNNEENNSATIKESEKKLANN